MFYSPLKHSLYRSIWLAALCSNIGTWIHTVTASLLMAKLTSSVTLIALVQTSAMLPILLFAIPGGVLGDIYNRKKIVIYTYSFMTGVASLMAILTYANYMTDWLLLTTLFLLNMGLAINQPASQAIISNILPKQEVKQAAVLANLSFNVSRSIGPAMAGYFYASLGPAWLFALNAISFIGIIAVFSTKITVPAKPTQSFSYRLLTAGFIDGWRFFKEIPLFKFIILKSTSYFILAVAVFALLPYIILIHYKMNNQALGLLTGAIGLGAIVNALLVHRLRVLASDHQLTTASMFLAATALIGINHFHTFSYLFICLLIFGYSWSMAVATYNGALQTEFADEIRARLVGIYFASFAAAQAVGSYLSGYLVQQAGITFALTTLSLAMLLLGFYYICFQSASIAEYSFCSATRNAS